MVEAKKGTIMVCGVFGGGVGSGGCLNFTVNSPREDIAGNKIVNEGRCEGGYWRKRQRQERKRGFLKETMQSPGNLIFKKCVQSVTVSPSSVCSLL